MSTPTGQPSSLGQFFEDVLPGLKAMTEERAASEPDGRFTARFDEPVAGQEVKVTVDAFPWGHSHAIIQTS
ncbi:hypothetical protein A2W32_03570 [candidate division WWE3 bacterium RBG_16_37_10]|uniref:Uncharacterized protein n=1 Tax=candidate division WWE3 bacterium RBG_16_37_10 TaxID=1802610 RepID=A0A1F4UTJ0_UNCKA|nr:MAG: hypothetical protein A2W32_03570 [candidate division WWE3 bacterium RBG_16_37_10]